MDLRVIKPEFETALFEKITLLISSFSFCLYMCFLHEHKLCYFIWSCQYTIIFDTQKLLFHLVQPQNNANLTLKTAVLSVRYMTLFKVLSTGKWRQVLVLLTILVPGPQYQHNSLTHEPTIHLTVCFFHPLLDFTQCIL
jgi:hypothetical protein